MPTERGRGAGAAGKGYASDYPNNNSLTICITFYMHHVPFSPLHFRELKISIDSKILKQVLNLWTDKRRSKKINLFVRVVKYE